MVVGILHLELHVPHAQSLKDRRSVVKSLKEQLRGKWNVATAEVEAGEQWQRASLGIVTVGDDREIVHSTLEQAVAWLRSHPTVELIQVEQELL